MATATQKAVTFKAPKTLAECGDQFYSVRNQRLALERQAAELQAQETFLREHLINNLPKSNATGVAGKLVRVSIETKTVYQAKDWDAVRLYIKGNAAKNPGVWGLMNKALNQAAVKELYESGKKVPGVEAMEVKVVSMNKLG